jgi:arginine deiminase
MPEPPQIRSEVGPLETVLVHRPDLELDRLTPENKDELLFDELVWVEQAQTEHDAFCDLLRDQGTDVLYVEQLLAQLLEDDPLAETVISEHVTDELCGPQLARRVRSFLGDLAPAEKVRRLIGGVTYKEVGDTRGVVAALRGPDDFVLPPLPNTVFTRDSSVWIGSGVALCPMNRIVRRRETGLLRVVYKNHPLFASSPIWFGAQPAETFPATFEGGDILVVGDDGIAIGVSERTTPTGAAALAARLFEAEVVSRILAVELPQRRSTMHLDTVVAMVDRDAFLLYPRIRHDVRVFRIMPGADGEMQVVEDGNLIRGLAWAAGIDDARVIEPPLDSFQAEREQWNDANNTFAVAPGRVIAYERNVATNEILEKAGIQVLVIPSYELPRGRGGPRCMTCPARRTPL